MTRCMLNRSADRGVKRPTRLCSTSQSETSLMLPVRWLRLTTVPIAWFARSTSRSRMTMLRSSSAMSDTFSILNASDRGSRSSSRAQSAESQSRRNDEKGKFFDCVSIVRWKPSKNLLQTHHRTSLQTKSILTACSIKFLIYPSYHSITT